MSYQEMHLVEWDYNANSLAAIGFRQVPKREGDVNLINYKTNARIDDSNYVVFLSITPDFSLLGVSGPIKEDAKKILNGLEARLKMEAKGFLQVSSQRVLTLENGIEFVKDDIKDFN